MSQGFLSEGKFSPTSISNPFRTKRLDRFLNVVGGVLAQQPSCNILDIGGTASYWNTYGHKIPKGVTISLVNLTQEEVPEGDIVSSFIGDARSLDSFADKSFDIVYSNSVIEHVGLWRDMAAMAGEVRRLAPRYFVQTPNYWFPIEAHYRLPFFHLLPDPIKQSLLL